jgi:hypothetical protein
MSAKTNKATLARIPLLVSAIEKYFQGQTLTLNGVKITAADLITALLAYATALTASQQAHASLAMAVKASKAQAVTGDNLIAGLEGYVRVMLGDDDNALLAFAMTPHKSGKRPVAVKAEAIEKSAATRVARHTLGPKEKAKIHGEVPPAPQAPEVKPKP